MSTRLGKTVIFGWGLAILLGIPLAGQILAAEGVPAGDTAEVRILAALEEKTTVQFIDEPLAGVVQYLMDLHGIAIHIDGTALEEIGIGVDEPVNKSLEGVSLRSALNLLLRDIGLDWTIANEVLLITTPEEARRNQVTRAYDVGELITARDGQGNLWRDFDSMIELLTSTIEPESWGESGGQASIEPFELRGAAGLVIRHTPKVHQQVGQLLEELTAMAAKGGDDIYPVREPRHTSDAAAAAGKAAGQAQPQ